MTRSVKPLPPQPVDQPAAFDFATAAAVRAVYHGNASADQQKLAMEWIIKQACAVQGISYRPNSDATIFHEGRRFPGIQILSLITLDISKLKDEP